MKQAWGTSGLEFSTDHPKKEVLAVANFRRLDYPSNFMDVIYDL